MKVIRFLLGSKHIHGYYSPTCTSGHSIKHLYARYVAPLYGFSNPYLLKNLLSPSGLVTNATNNPLNHAIYTFLNFLTVFSAKSILTHPFTLSLPSPAMALRYTCCVFILFLSLSNTFQATVDKQTRYFTLLKKYLSGHALFDWNGMADDLYCNYTGISCNSQGYVTKIDISGLSLSGYLPPDVCSYLPELRVLDISNNKLQGSFPESVINCSLLEKLNMSSLYLSGKLPNFSSMRSLKSLDLSYNLFDGDFPMSITNLTNLKDINFNENGNLNLWQLPENISQLTKLKRLVLMTCMIHGYIPASIGNMTSLTDIELSGNYIRGQIPPELGKLKNLQLLMLYYNQLTGIIPEELGNLTRLVMLDMSVNHLTGTIPESICRLPHLQTLQIYNNSLTGKIPAALGDSKSLSFLSLYDNFLTGEVPYNLGKSSPLVLLDLSENRLTSQLPPHVCHGGQLLYFLILSNMFTGKLPNSYTRCMSLIRFRVNYNRLEGSIPEGLFGLPHVSIIDLSSNQLTGPISKAIGTAKNLSELFLQNNRLSGVLPPEISGAINLVKIDLSNNLLSGPLPTQIGNLKRLNLLMLQENRFNSSIPNSLSSLTSLNVLDLSNNQLTGNIPESLAELLPNSLNFSYNNLSGSIPLSLIKGGLEESFVGNPGLCASDNINSSDKSFSLCPQASTKKRLDGMWVIAVSAFIVVIGIILFLRRWLSKERTTIKHDETMSSSYYSYDVKSFHRISFGKHEIIEAMVDTNILGHGGSGSVYRIGLKSGEVVAVKKLWSQQTKDSASEDRLSLDKELKTEVETLGNIRHKNIVKLYSYFSSLDCSLLVYEYMPNGNLWDALHKGKIILDWPTRHQIALGVAQGLAYLHHDLLPPIIHRDVKSSNILLDADYQPKVADFGVAKVMRARVGKDSSSTCIAGTYGYLDPDYVNSSKATTKCDVYSYGVVLMELVTGKKPVETEFGENKNIINWILTKTETKEGTMEVLDKRLSGSYKDGMEKVLRIAIRCTARAPKPRPTMNEIVQWLIEADSYQFDSSKLTNKTRESSNATKPNKAFESSLYSEV